MLSTASATGTLLGAQRPRIAVVPDAATGAGREAIELAAAAGLHLDDWEAWSLDQALREREDGKWAAFEVGTVVARQNGKGSILEARELAGALLFGERLLIHSAHEQATSSEHFLRVLALIEEADFSSRLKQPVRGKGSEAILFKDGTRIMFKTRTGGGGRGFTGDFVALDEAMILAEEFMGALVPTMAARSVQGNPQLWYAGSAVDRLNPKHDGVVLSRLRSRALKGEPGIAYLEWSIDAKNPTEVPESVQADPNAWAEANPGLGIRISQEYVANERGALAPRTFCVERLTVGDWIDVDAPEKDGLTVGQWMECADSHSTLTDPVVLVFDVKPDRSAAAICAGGFRDDGLRHVEVVDHHKGTGWVVPRLKELQGRHDVTGIRYHKRSPAASLVKACEEEGVDITPVTDEEYVQACGGLIDAVMGKAFRHRGSDELQAAVRGAEKRPLVDSWAWSRKNSSVDITPLVGATLALWAAEESAGDYFMAFTPEELASA
jgi:hypothetical protein